MIHSKGKESVNWGGILSATPTRTGQRKKEGCHLLIYVSLRLSRSIGRWRIDETVPKVMEFFAEFNPETQRNIVYLHL